MKLVLAGVNEAKQPILELHMPRDAYPPSVMEEAKRVQLEQLRAAHPTKDVRVVVD